MPYAFETHHIRLQKKDDARYCKLDDDDKARIRALYKQGVPIRRIAADYSGVCSRGTIQFILFPERKVRVAADYKERRKDGRYYDKDKHRLYMRKYRRRKQKILKKTN